MKRRSRRILRVILGACLVLLCSHLLRAWLRPEGGPGNDWQRLGTYSVSNRLWQLDRVKLRFREGDAPGNFRELPVIALSGERVPTFPGSVGYSGDYLIPLPWLGRDHSVGSQVLYLNHLLDVLDVGEVHLVADGLAAPVALALAAQSSREVKSLVLLDPEGLLDYELLGDQVINRSLRILEWLLCAGVRELVPFSWLVDWHDRTGYRMKRAKMLFQSDLALTRTHAQSFESPALIMDAGGVENPRGSSGAEFHRLIAQSFRIADADPGADASWDTGLIAQFHNSVEAGESPGKGEASEARIQQSLIPFEEVYDQSFSGYALLGVLVLLCLSTLISEDLACVGAGLLVARGSVGFWEAASACFAGIFLGDIGLYGLGRLFGQGFLRHRPFRWFVSKNAVLKAEAWFERRGPWVIAASRVMPGARMTIYLAAGILKTSFWQFSMYLAGASAVATVILVFVSSVLGAPILAVFEALEHWVIVGVVSVIIATFLAIHLVVPWFSYRGRRLALGRWRRLTRWEFWPSLLLYPPVVAHILWLGLKHRQFTLFTLSNPMLECGGLIGESQANILEKLQAAGVPVAPFDNLRGNASLEDWRETIQKFRDAHVPEGDPIVIKPDVGRKGGGVRIVKSESELDAILGKPNGEDRIIQKYVDGREYGLFYVRHPDESKGRLISITEKLHTAVRGDGIHDLEQLILKDDRAVCFSNRLLKVHSARLYEVVPDGEEVKVVEIGARTRGSLFLDGWRLHTPELETAVDQFASKVPGFHLGRFDVKVPSEQSLKLGQGIEVIEFNLLSAEPTHMYDPKHSIFHAWRTLMQQWTQAFEIAATNRERGGKPLSLWQLIRLVGRNL